MQQQIDWMTGKPDEYVAQGWQSETAAFSGQLQKAREFSDRAFELAERRDQKDVAAQIAVGGATRDALFGDCKQAKEQTAKALGITNNPVTIVNAGNALATCGEFTQTQTIISDLTQRFPTDTVLNKILVPLVQARIEFQKGNAAQAIQLLETTRPYEGYAPSRSPTCAVRHTSVNKKERRPPRNSRRSSTIGDRSQPLPCSRSHI